MQEHRNDTSDQFTANQQNVQTLTNTVKGFCTDLNELEARLKNAETHLPAKSKSNPINTDCVLVLNNDEDNDVNKDDDISNPFIPVPPRKHKNDSPRKVPTFPIILENQTANETTVDDIHSYPYDSQHHPHTGE